MKKKKLVRTGVDFFLLFALSALSIPVSFNSLDHFQARNPKLSPRVKQSDHGHLSGVRVEHSPSIPLMKSIEKQGGASRRLQLFAYGGEGRNIDSRKRIFRKGGRNTLALVFFDVHVHVEYIDGIALDTFLEEEKGEGRGEGRKENNMSDIVFVFLDSFLFLKKTFWIPEGAM